MLNLQQEISLPDDIFSFKGSKGKFNVTNETLSYALSFGEKSDLDEKVQSIFKEFVARVEGTKYYG